MKKTALLLSFCALLAACDSGYKKDGPDEARANETTADGAANEADSSATSNLSAVAQQPQIDTSANKIGTEHPGGTTSAGADNGLKLMAASDCGACHQVKMKVVGPAYTAVAQKYEATDANITMLANKVIEGGKGNWGEVPMTPHPALSLADAKEMTKYILSLK